MKKLTYGILATITLMLTPTVNADTDDTTPTMVVCYTAGSVNKREAKKATQSMLDELAKLGGWKPGDYHSKFTAKPSKCLKLLNEKTTHFISPSLGFYLEHRKDLVPVARPKLKGKNIDKWYLVVKKGKYTSLNDLKGKIIGGPLVDDVEFLKRIIFKGKIDPAKFFVLKRSSRVLRALRKTVRGKIDGVLLNQQQYDALPSLPFAKDLTAIFASDPIPVPSLLAVRSRTTEKERKRFARALFGFCQTPKGKGFCKMFGIETFEPVNEKAYKDVIKHWSKQ